MDRDSVIGAYGWHCRGGCERTFRASLPGEAYDHLCEDCDARTPAERVALRTEWIERDRQQALAAKAKGVPVL